MPFNTVSLIAPQLIFRGKVTTASRAALGISFNNAFSLSAESVGIVVRAATGPAAKAGIVPGELITAVNGLPVTSVTDFQAILGGRMPDKHVTVSVTTSSGQKSSVYAVLADLAQL